MECNSSLSGLMSLASLARSASKSSHTQAAAGASATATSDAGYFPSMNPSHQFFQTAHHPLANDLPPGQWSPPRLARAKSNKVSKLLHLVHDKAADYVYAPKQGAAAVATAGGASSAIARAHADHGDGHVSAISSSAATSSTINRGSPDGPTVNAIDTHDWFSMTDDQVIAAACDNTSSKMICNQAVKKAMKGTPENRSHIAELIRNKPAHAQASKILYHALFGLTVNEVEAKNYDEKLDKVINLAATKSPYGFAAVKALDYAL